MFSKYRPREDGRFFNSLIVALSLFSEYSDLSQAAFIVTNSNTASWHVNALVEATPISGPA